MKKSKKVLLSAAIAAAIMGSVSLPQTQAADISDGIKVSTSHGTLDNTNWLKTDTKINETDDVSLAKQSDLAKVNSEADTAKKTADNAQATADAAQAAANNAQKTADSNKQDIKDIKDNMKDSLDKAAQATDKANSAANDAQVAADKANQAADNIKSDLDKKVDKDTYNKDKTTIAGQLDKLDEANGAQDAKIKNNAQAAANAQNTANKAQDTADKAQSAASKAQETADGAVAAAGTAQSTASAAADAAEKAQKTADGAQKDATKANDKADAALKVIGNGALSNGATNLTDGVNQNTLAAEKAQKAADNAQKTADANTDSINALDGRVTTNESNIAKNTTAIANETNDRVAADTVLSNRITENSSAIQSLRHDVSDLGTEIDNVGAISAALAGLHPLDWNGSGSKFQLSAAAGTYDGKQAMAFGGFYHPNRNMMLSLGVSSSFGSDRKTAGNVGVTFRVGKGSNGTVSDDVAERLAAMDQKISQLESQNQKLTSMLAIVDPSLTKEFPDVPANHWAYEAVSKLAGNGIVEGYPDGDFHGDRTMTRYEMAQVIYKALKKGGTVDQKLVKEFNKEIEAVKANDANEAK